MSRAEVHGGLPPSCPPAGGGTLRRPPGRTGRNSSWRTGWPWPGTPASASERCPGCGGGGHTATLWGFGEELVLSGHSRNSSGFLTWSCMESSRVWCTHTDLLSTVSRAGHFLVSLWSFCGSYLVQRNKMFIFSKPCLFEWLFFFFITKPRTLRKKIDRVYFLSK